MPKWEYYSVEVIYLKRMVILILSVVLGLSLISCGEKVKYTEEFAYLPAYPGMTFAEKKPTEDQSFTNATYKVTNVKGDEVLKNYEDILKNDGWKVTQDNKPSTITVEKDKHMAVIVPIQEQNDVTIFISTK